MCVQFEHIIILAKICSSVIGSVLNANKLTLINIFSDLYKHQTAIELRLLGVNLAEIYLLIWQSVYDQTTNLCLCVDLMISLNNGGQERQMQDNNLSQDCTSRSDQKRPNISRL